MARAVGRPPDHVRRYYAGFSYQAGSWDRKRRVVAKVEWHPGELHHRVGFIVTNLSRSAERVTWFYNQRGKAEQYIKEGKNAIKWTRLSCRKFRDNAVRLQLHALTLQSRQLHADTGLAEGSRALVDDDITREAGENRWQGCPTWPLRYLSTGRSGGSERLVRDNSTAD